MKKFLLNLSIFLLPGLLLISVPLIILKKSKEVFYDIDETIKNNDKYIIGYAYDETNYRYLKWKRIKELERSEVWSLGSSRTLQFREGMFSIPFYNAGYTIIGLNDFSQFLKSVSKSKYPKYLIIALDQWMFNEKWDDLSTKPKTDLWRNSFNKYPQGKTIIKVLSDVLVKKHNLSFLFRSNDNLIGLNSILNHKGFRNDGSMLYGSQIYRLENKDATADDYEFNDTFKRIEKGNAMFEYGNDVNNNAIPVLEELLSFCSSNNIKVIAYLPPFADKVVSKMEKSGNYKYINNIYSTIHPTFAKYRYEVYDFTHLSSINANDNEMLDGFHGGESVYLKMLINIAEADTSLHDIVNLTKLKLDLKNVKNNFTIYNY